MTRRHFFIVGAQRSGTTYLYRLLDEHPQSCMAKPVRPEPKFFLREDFSTLCVDDYAAAHFAEQKAIRFGEKSTSYIESPIAAERIAAWFPDAEIVFLLRDPIDRAISNYNFSRHHGHESCSMEKAFLEEEARAGEYDHARLSASPFAYLSRGRYVEYIRTYAQWFPPEQLHCYILESLAGKLESVVTVFRDLNLDPTFVPTGLKRVVNAAPPAEQLSLSLEAKLMRYFQDSVRDLRDHLGQPLSVWRDY